MAAGHAPFAVLNRTGNPIVKGLLGSSLHPVVSRRLALITVRGKRSGREYTFPVGYVQRGDRVTITVEWPQRKRWWRNLIGGAPVRIRVRGVERSGYAEARGDERTGIVVEVALDPAT